MDAGWRQYVQHRVLVQEFFRTRGMGICHVDSVHWQSALLYLDILAAFIQGFTWLAE
jgi:hypothetical protein